MITEEDIIRDYFIARSPSGLYALVNKQTGRRMTKWRREYLVLSAKDINKVLQGKKLKINRKINSYKNNKTTKTKDDNELFVILPSGRKKWRRWPD